MSAHEKYGRAKQITSAPATPEKIYTIKTGKNAGMKRKVNAKPERIGLLPVTEKTLWTWVREGKFPKPIRLSGNVTVWRMSEVEAWIEEQATIATMEA
ncbi:AlpA family phage regulatory protein [uncultured Acinetobacter sp.]|uniref:helix-turn-helix transcriptional regulator n=1 Tax=uncultured Acinetobacter sp. TaxID=165433 RepID=UPI00260979E5|nr:AlpA family phage regulatory protein [uncultured Acinetobacter sp.]